MTIAPNSPKVLSLESSGRSGSVGLLDGQVVVSEATLPSGTRTAAGFAPLIAAQLAGAGWKATDIDLVAVTSGPGSFTGLRVGTTTAKVFAYAAKSELIGVDTLHAIAFRLSSEAGEFVSELTRPGSTPARLSVVMDAQRKELFFADFEWSSDGELTMKSECRIVDALAWMEGLDADTRVVGPGLSMKLADGATVNERLLESDSPPMVMPVESWAATAAGVGRLACSQYEEGVRDDLWKLVPQYHRLSYAEENAAK